VHYLLAAAVPDPVPILVAGGTTGLILGLIIAVVALATERVVPGASRARAEDREARALEAGGRATAAVEHLTSTLESYQQLVERLLAERGKPSP
jgi:hypothetical protein